MLSEFVNEALLDFAVPAHREAMGAALAEVRAEGGSASVPERARAWPLAIGGEAVETGEWIDSFDPCQPDRVVGRVAKARRGEAEHALNAAWNAFEDWSRWRPDERAGVLLKTAALLRRRKHLFSATLVYEAAKSWPEADADTAEAIDFLEYYAREAIRLGQPSTLLTPLPGEHAELSYLPLGVGVVIPPWNFPLAIAVGMTAAALVTGNAVILKPASLTPVVAARFAALFQEAGLPPGVLSFLPGGGGEIGDFLVDHPRTRFVSFTGSREVGTRIYERAARVQPGQRWLKRVVAEMGGKDAIVVDETADLDAAAEGIVASAYGFQGQKCSAASRAIVTAPVYGAVLERVVARAEALRVGPAEDPASQMAAVIDEAQFRKVLEYVDVGKREGRLVLGGEAGAGPAADPKRAADAGRAAGLPGWYIQPTIIADLPEDARLAREEVFGPVLGFLRAADYEHALRVANGTEYGLTGGVYSRDRRRLEQARATFHVGNLYFNRKITGALVGAHPFGGFNMSGTDSKAGGPDYLSLFTQAQVVAERF